MDELHKPVQVIDADVDGKLATGLFIGTMLILLLLIYSLASAAAA